MANAPTEIDLIDPFEQAKVLLARAQGCDLPQERAKYLNAAQRWYRIATASVTLRDARAASGRPIGT